MSKLVLTRSAGQSVMVGDAKLEVLDVQGARVYVRHAGHTNWVKLHGTITVGEATMYVGRINRGNVSLAFDAERSVTIMRSELLK